MFCTIKVTSVDPLAIYRLWLGPQGKGRRTKGQPNTGSRVSTAQTWESVLNYSQEKGKGTGRRNQVGLFVNFKPFYFDYNKWMYKKSEAPFILTTTTKRRSTCTAIQSAWDHCNVAEASNRHNYVLKNLLLVNSRLL